MHQYFSMIHRKVGSIFVHSVYGRCKVVACYPQVTGFRVVLTEADRPQSGKTVQGDYVHLHRR
jgi:hypothetical protein